MFICKSYAQRSKKCKSMKNMIYQLLNIMLNLGKNYLKYKII
jgi:hypothetical protein